MSMEKSRELAIQYVMNTLTAEANEWLEGLDDPENESYVIGKNGQIWLSMVECLLIQIQHDSERGDIRSAFRKLLLLRGILMKSLE